MKRSLLIGCGNSRVKQVQMGGVAEWAGELTTMDMNPNCGADLVFDMDSIPSSRHPTECSSAVRLPFDDDTFDDLAYGLNARLMKMPVTGNGRLR